MDLLEFSKKHGKGHCKTGKRKKWKKKHHFAKDLMILFEDEWGKDKFKTQFAGYTSQQIQHFFEKIKSNLIRVRESETHARNKLLLWLDRNHNKQNLHDIAKVYKIGLSTAKGYIKQVEQAVLKTFKNSSSVRTMTSLKIDQQNFPIFLCSKK